MLTSLLQLPAFSPSLELAEAHFRGQKLWRSSDNATTHVRQEAAGLPAPLPLDEWSAFVKEHHRPPPALDASTDQFFDFIPAFVGAPTPGAAAAAFSTPCFGEVTASAEMSGDDEVQVTFVAKKPRSLGCHDLSVLTTTQSVHMETVRALHLGPKHTVRWSGLAPLEAAGVLIKRPPEVLARDVHMGYYYVYTRDDSLLAVAQLKRYSESHAELGCLVVDKKYRRQGTGDAMLGFMERTAVAAGVTNLFVLSTVTMQWFLERAFTEVSLDALPERRVAIYDKARNSKIYMKSVSDSTRLLDAEELFAGL